MPTGQPPKYAQLQRCLELEPGTDVTLTFAEIEAIIGAPLPQSAGSRSWWSNRAAQSHTRTWLAVGWRVSRVQARHRRVRFVRVVEE